jgi:hypothetical protein
MITDLGEDVEHAAGAILRARIGLPLRRISPVGAPVDGIGTLEGRVGISGAWCGDAVVRCGVGLARRVAGVMYSVPPQRARVHQIQGAVSELAFLMAAGLAAVLPQPCHVSPPLVRAACDADAQQLDGPVRAEARLECEGEPLVLLLVERSAGD